MFTDLLGKVWGHWLSSPFCLVTKDSVVIAAFRPPNNHPGPISSLVT
jgi:hypothetical protein